MLKKIISTGIILTVLLFTATSYAAENKETDGKSDKKKPALTPADIVKKGLKKSWNDEDYEEITLPDIEVDQNVFTRTKWIRKLVEPVVTDNGDEITPVVEPTEPTPWVDWWENHSNLKYWGLKQNMLFEVEPAYLPKAGKGHMLFGFDFFRGPYADRFAATSSVEFTASRSMIIYQLEYGFTDWLGMTLTGPYVTMQDINMADGTGYWDSGLYDSLLGLKVRVIKERRKNFIPTVAVGFGASVPLGGEGVMLYDTSAGGYGSVHVSKEFESFACHGFVRILSLPGGKFGEEDIDGVNETKFGLGVTLFSQKAINVIAEIYGEQEFTSDQEGRNQSLLYFAPGMEFDISKDSAFGFNLVKGLSEQGYDFGLGLKFQFYF